MFKMFISLIIVCGIEVLLYISFVIKWDIFVNVVENFYDVVVEIEKLKNKVKIKEIKFDFMKVDGDDIFKYCEINYEKIIKFFECFLNFCIGFWGKYNEMKCVVIIDR